MQPSVHTCGGRVVWPVRLTFLVQPPNDVPVTICIFMNYQHDISASFEYEFIPTTSRIRSQMTTSFRIGVHETFRSVPYVARLPRGIFQSVRYSTQRRCQTCLTTSGRNFKHLS
ncbi:hypothetical protein TNCV_868381 [Trichonephila clavipes]|nr:hypothetical protein TNCV_868381 [Trichonephila clavipes]